MRPALFLSMQFASGVAYMWTGSGPYPWNGETWLGAGRILSFSAFEEGSDPKARGIVIGMSGIDTTIMSDVINDFVLGNPVMVWQGWFDDSGNLIGAPTIAWGGRMDKPSVKISGKTASIDIACETRLIENDVPAGRRRTNDDCTQLVSGDLGFSFVSGCQETTILFGGSSTIVTRNV